ncbi:hypothetical protein HBI88_155220 [Parastagonospora nodorum]|nr:hypothetical protein HBI97_036020 [Parastagonospora nodorum]KAH5832333.1 hypothetical protein HBI96_012750 [Parastagonospora nodorum]KAH5835263.1 hypothetical protein HBI94_018440 [Parastagonospora nodorum]KAH5859090.1 hypothetical protein HBI90_162500 [Parastagonospora nodorum]KAH5881144.1 hypothetical protein HBI91_021330 [Parastagonospora nodorum]
MTEARCIDAGITGLNMDIIKLCADAKVCVDIAINCDNAAKAVEELTEGREMDKSHSYHCFNVMRQPDAVDLVDWSLLNDVKAYVDIYLRDNDIVGNVQECGRPCPNYVARATSHVRFEVMMANNNQVVVTYWLDSRGFEFVFSPTLMLCRYCHWHR